MNGIAELYRLADVEAGKPAPMMVFPVGDWTSAKYPRLSLSQELADEVIANFEADVLRTRVPIDTNHDAKSPANGWVDRLYMAPFEWSGVSGEALFADWTPNERGAQTVNAGEYAYDSLEIGSHEDPVTGTVYDNVLKAISLTNRPVLRMMPAVLEAGEALKLSEPIELQLSEVAPADDDPMASLLADLEAVLAKAGDTLKGKPGVRAIRTYLRETLTKASAHKLAEAGSTNDRREALQEAMRERFGEHGYIDDFGPDWLIFSSWSELAGDHYWRCEYEVTEGGITLGQPVEVKRETTYVPADSSPTGRETPSSSIVASGKAGEGDVTRLAEGDAAREGAETHMKTVIEYLNALGVDGIKLAEDASEADVLAGTMKLAEERDAHKAARISAEVKLADHEKQVRTEKATATVDALVEKGRVKPGRKDELLKLAEDAPEAFEITAAALAETAEGSALKLGEKGTGKTTVEGSALESDDVTVELAERARVRAERDHISPAEAMKLELSEDKDLADRYANRTL